MIEWKCLININKSLLYLSSSDNIFINKKLIPVNNKIAFHCRNFTRNCEIDKTYSSEGVIYIARSNIKYGKIIKILFKSILLDIFSDFDFGPDVREEEQKDKDHCNQATEFKYMICIFSVTLEACPGMLRDLGWSYLWQKLMAGNRCLLSRRARSKILRTPLSTLEILIYYYIFFGAEYTDLMGPLL